MALEHADNFSIYGGNIAFMLNGLYASVGQSALVADPDGVDPGSVLQTVGSLSQDGVRYVLSNFQSTVGMAARLWCPSLPGSSDATPAMSIMDTTGNSISSIGFDTTGRLSIYDGNAGRFGIAPIATTSAPVISANAWWHIEVKWTVTGATFNLLNYEVRVEGATVLSGTATLTSHPNQPAQVLLGCFDFASQPFMWKDFVVWNGAGSQNNTFLGSVIVTNLVPNADISLNWTPSTGTTGFPILADNPPDNTKFISAPYPSIPAAYVGGLTDLPSNTTTVKGVITLVRAAKSDGGDGSLQNGIISATVHANGANRPITTTQTYWQDVFEVDPATSAAWLPAAVNAMTYQINRTT